MRKGRVLLAVIAPLIAVGLLDTTLDSLIESLIFQPTLGADLSPEQVGVEGEDLYLTTEDGVKIHAFYLPSPHGPSSGLPSGNARALLFLHGNAGNASHRLPNAAELGRLGCAVLVLEYRGYGLSDGRPTESGSYLDAQAGLAALIDRGFSSRRIVLFGRSLGGAIAVDLAQDRDLGGVILESTFTSLAAVARTIGGPIMSYLAGSRFESIDKISRVRAPLLFFHGDRDEVIDYRLGRALFEAAPEPKAFETIAGAGHNDTTQVGGRRYFERIGAFLDEVVPMN